MAGIVALAALSSCNMVKKVPEGKYLLRKNKIIYRFNSAQKNKGLTNDITGLGKEGIQKFEIPERIAPSEIMPYIKQKPNTRIIFVFPFYLYLYDLPDSANTAKAKIRRDSAYVIKAQRKGWSREKLKRKMERKTGREWLMSQGEAPVILDSALVQKSAQQVKAFLFDKGYFNADVKDSIHYEEKKADVSYILKPGKPYKINEVNYLFEDPTLAALIYADTANSKLHKNDDYDQDVLDAERDRITADLNNVGYFYFTKQYINYTLDTNSKAHLVNITLNIKKFALRDKNNRDSIIETNHIAFYIRHVTVQMDYDPTKATLYYPKDSIVYQGLTIVSPDGLPVKAHILKPRIVIISGDKYSAENTSATYTSLSQLNEFSYVSVKFQPVKDSADYLDCFIQLMPVVKHDVRAETEATNTGGDLGVQGDVLYANYNQFNGAEKLQLKISGGLIAQQVLVGNGNILLNTEDLGPELDLAVPRPLFPYNGLMQAFPFNYIHYDNPQTVLKLTFDYQLRLKYYVRHVVGLSYGLDFASKDKKSRFTIALFEWNFVNAFFTPEFHDELEEYNVFFQNSFQNQVITDGRFSWTHSNQDNTKRQTHFHYVKTDLEWSGLAFDALQHWHLLYLPMESGSYYIRQFNSPYSQYTKIDGDYRHYWILDKAQKQKIVVRAYAGFGLPYGNSTELPFTKSFWAGGSNDIRAWQFQTLGPGGSSPSPSASQVIAQVGETKLEGNWEYRVSLIKYFGLAFFVDAGNIWLWNTPTNQTIPLSTFQLNGANPAWTEIAVGTGIGFRFDFTYFVFRLDLGEPFRDPSLAAGRRVIPLDKYSLHKTVLNIGIGYPF